MFALAMRVHRDDDREVLHLDHPHRFRGAELFELVDACQAVNNGNASYIDIASYTLKLEIIGQLLAIFSASSRLLALIIV
jgi:hypothetical protein